MSETAVAPLVEKPDVVQEAKDAVEKPFTDVYNNPLESSSRMGLTARAYAYRAGASVAFGMGNMVSPAVPSPHKTIYLDSTFSKRYNGKDKIKADVWTPDRPRALSRKSSKSSLRSLKKDKRKNGNSNATTPGNNDTDYLRPTLSRTSTGVSVTEEEADGNLNSGLEQQKKRPSTLSRLSSRLSTRSSKSLKTSKSRSAISLPSTPPEPIVNPMEQIPSSLHPQADPHSRRPAVINFHGGGFVLGQGTDDGRWAMAVMQALGAVVFSVEYRLAPSYPFPTPVEDCADAILQIRRRADEFWIDPDKIILSGFSAGGTLALASWVLLTDYKRWGYTIKPDPGLAKDMSRLTVTAPDSGAEGTNSASHNGARETGGEEEEDPTVPRPAGLMLFYPLLDWTMSRPRKRLTCSKPDQTLPRSLTDVFDASYIYPPEELKSQLDNPLLSPGLMPDDLVDKLPPVQLCLCEYDMLLAEGKRFAERVQSRGKEVAYRVVKEAKHAWDKPPPFSPPESMGVEYSEAVRAMARWLGTEDGNNSGESLAKSEASSVKDSTVPENEVV